MLLKENLVPRSQENIHKLRDVQNGVGEHREVLKKKAGQAEAYAEYLTQVPEAVLPITSPDRRF